jgi:hypothetical protein
VLFGAEKFPRLRSLNLHGSYIGGAGANLGKGGEKGRLDRLFTGEPTTPLRKLDLGLCCLTDAGAEHLAAWPGLANLRWLDLNNNLFSESGYRAIARSPHAGNLKYLNLNRYDFDRFPKVKAELDARFGAVLHYG